MCEGVQARIAKSKMRWFENLNMSLTVIEVLSNGYKLLFVQIPDSCFIPYNNSALHEDEFIRRAIEEILTKRCILEVDSLLYCCNLLTVVRGKKLLLVIDSSRSVNKNLQACKFKYEGLPTLSRSLRKNFGS